MAGFVNPTQPGMGAKPDPLKPPPQRPLGTRGGNDPYASTGRGGATVGMGSWGPIGTNNGAPDPGKGGGKNTPTTGGAVPGITPPNPYGSESGNTYLEDRYLARLYGQDPAFNYAMKRGTEALGNQYSTAGAYNSGAARQGESDLYANLIAQSQGQLDALAAGATGARQNKTNSMFNQLYGLTSGMAGTGTAYDLKSAGSNDALMNALIQLMGGKAGADDKSRQSLLNNGAGLLSLIFG